MSTIQKKYDDITPQEWSEYKWFMVDSFSDEYVRGAKKTQPPDDGYEYVDVTALGDAEQNWVRGKMKDE